MKNISLQQLKNKYIEEGLLLVDKKEKEYTKKNSIIFTRFTNDAKLLSVNRKVADQNFASSNITFNTGSYFDPLGFKGAHHFFEHLIFNDKLDAMAADNYVSHNAYTSQDKVTVVASGLFNSKDTSFGILPVLDLTIQTLKNFRTTVSDNKFEREKEVIMHEIVERDANYQIVNNDLLNNKILNPQNPLSEKAIGTHESVGKITKDLIFKIAENQISSSNMTFSLYSENENNDHISLHEKMAEIIKEFPRRKAQQINIENYSKINKLPVDNLVAISSPIKNKLIANYLLWEIDVPIYSLEDTTLTIVFSYLQQTFFTKARNLGLGYSVGLFITNLFPFKSLIGAYVIGKSDEYEKSMELLNMTVKEFFEEVMSDDNQISKMLDLEKKRQALSPIPQSSRLSRSLESLQYFDCLIDNDFWRKKLLQCTASDAKSVIANILKSKPYRIAVGDL